MTDKELSPVQRERVKFEQREPLYAEDLMPGREFEPDIFVVSENIIADAIKASGVSNDLYRDDSVAGKLGYKARIAPQTFAFTYGRLAYIGTKYRPAPGSIITGLSLEFIKPPVLNDVLTSRARVKSAEQKNGKEYRVIRAETVDQNGDLISIMEFSVICRSRKINNT